MKKIVSQHKVNATSNLDVVIASSSVHSPELSLFLKKEVSVIILKIATEDCLSAYVQALSDLGCKNPAVQDGNQDTRLYPTFAAIQRSSWRGLQPGSGNLAGTFFLPCLSKEPSQSYALAPWQFCAAAFLKVRRRRHAGASLRRPRKLRCESALRSGTRPPKGRLPEKRLRGRRDTGTVREILCRS